MQNNLTIIHAKDVQMHCNVSKNTAHKLIKDIKETYEIQIVTMSHLLKYLKV